MIGLIYKQALEPEISELADTIEFRPSSEWHKRWFYAVVQWLQDFCARLGKDFASVFLRADGRRMVPNKEMFVNRKST